jgi:hypothetical protein
VDFVCETVFNEIRAGSARIITPVIFNNNLITEIIFVMYGQCGARKLTAIENYPNDEGYVLQLISAISASAYIQCGAIFLLSKT